MTRRAKSTTRRATRGVRRGGAAPAKVLGGAGLVRALDRAQAALGKTDTSGAAARVEEVQAAVKAGMEASQEMDALKKALEQGPAAGAASVRREIGALAREEKQDVRSAMAAAGELKKQMAQLTGAAKKKSAASAAEVKAILAGVAGSDVATVRAAIDHLLPRVFAAQTTRQKMLADARRLAEPMRAARVVGADKLLRLVARVEARDAATVADIVARRARLDRAVGGGARGGGESLMDDAMVILKIAASFCASVLILSLLGNFVALIAPLLIYWLTYIRDLGDDGEFSVSKMLNEHRVVAVLFAVAIYVIWRQLSEDEAAY